MKGLIFAIQFLTIIPASSKEPFAPDKAIPFFPVTGILIGLLLAACDTMVLRFWPAPVAAVLDVIFLAVITGALHLDGLGDTADGLYGRWPRDKALAIMKDSRIGAMGVVAIVGCLGIKWGGLASMDAGRSLLLVIVPAYARGAMMFGMASLEYGRPDGGTGLSFFSRKITPFEYAGLLVPVLLSIWLGWKGVVLNIVFVVIVLSLLGFYKKRIGCITGDMLGAMTEITEAILFLACAMKL